MLNYVCDFATKLLLSIMHEMCVCLMREGREGESES